MALVEIYIDTENQIQRKTLHRYGYILMTEYRGEMNAVTGYGDLVGTYHETSAMALEAAVGRILRKCDILVYSPDPWLCGILEHLHEWELRDFKSQMDKPIGAAESWRRICAKLEQLKIEHIDPVPGVHANGSYIKSHIKKRILEEQAKSTVNNSAESI